MNETDVEETDPTTYGWSGVMMFYVGGDKEPFRCEFCGSNCFRRRIARPERIKCNGCGTRYYGES